MGTRCCRAACGEFEGCISGTLPSIADIENELKNGFSGDKAQRSTSLSLMVYASISILATVSPKFAFRTPPGLNPVGVSGFPPSHPCRAWAVSAPVHHLHGIHHFPIDANVINNPLLLFSKNYIHQLPQRTRVIFFQKLLIYAANIRDYKTIAEGLDHLFKMFPNCTTIGKSPIGSILETMEGKEFTCYTGTPLAT